MMKQFRLIIYILIIFGFIFMIELSVKKIEKISPCNLIAKNGKIYKEIDSWSLTKEKKSISFYNLQYDGLLDIPNLKILFQAQNIYNEDYECFYNDDYYVYGLIGYSLAPLFSGFDSSTINILTGCGKTKDGIKYTKTCVLGGCFKDKYNIYYPSDEFGKYIIESGTNMGNLPDNNILNDC